MTGSDGWGRTRVIWDKDLECFIDVTPGSGSNREPERLVGPSNLIGDIENYAAVGIQDPKGPYTKPLVITKGRRQHRDELRCRELTEVGNERSGWSQPKSTPVRSTEVREALAKSGYYDGARTIRELRRQGR